MTAAATHLGFVRKRNEDSYYAGVHLVAVADGLGGHVAGDVASSTVIETIRPYDRAVPASDLCSHLGRAVHAATVAMRERVSAEPHLAGMGSTLVGVLRSGLHAAVANVGDSRAYLFRDGRLTQITEDHVYGHLVVGATTVPRLPERLSRFIDSRSDGRSPDLTPLELRPADRLLLCSDGLSSFVPHERIEKVLIDTRSADGAVQLLVQAALGQGGLDNVTVVVLDA